MTELEKPSQQMKSLRCFYEHSEIFWIGAQRYFGPRKSDLQFGSFLEKSVEGKNQFQWCQITDEL